jgi:hypothetical protein
MVRSPSAALVSVLSLAIVSSTSACSVESTSAGGGLEEDPPADAPASGGESSTPKPADEPDEKDSEPEEKEEEESVDKTVHFELTLDGASIVPDVVKVEVQPAKSDKPARLVIDAKHQQDLKGGFTSTATFTLSLDLTEKGKDTCSSVRSASYFFKHTDGSLSGIGTSYAGGSCMMDITANEADGFSSGTATGVLGGVTTKSFSVAWGQNLPQ